jgi:hypothetical protein
MNVTSSFKKLSELQQGCTPLPISHGSARKNSALRELSQLCLKPIVSHIRSVAWLACVMSLSQGGSLFWLCGNLWDVRDISPEIEFIKI